MMQKPCLRKNYRETLWMNAFFLPNTIEAEEHEIPLLATGFVRVLILVQSVEQWLKEE
jgi:hypothetical protein